MHIEVVRRVILIPLKSIAAVNSAIRDLQY